MKRGILIAMFLGFALALADRTSAQGSFINLDFEDGTYIPLVGNPYYPYGVATADALPGWQTYIGGNLVDTLWYNTMSLGAAAIAWHGPAGPGIGTDPFHGSYSVFLQPSFPNGAVSAAIGQTGQIPPDARSLIFYEYNAYFQVTFAGQPVTTFDMGGVNGQYSYHKFVADISPFAGQTGEMRFTGGAGNLDYIQFSPEPIPEPSVCYFLIVGLVAWACVSGSSSRLPVACILSVPVQHLKHQCASERNHTTTVSSGAPALRE